MTDTIAVTLTSENCNKFLKYVILKEKFHKHFTTSVHIFPKDKDFLKYWKYRKHIKFWGEKKTQVKNYFLIQKKLLRILF